MKFKTKLFEAGKTATGIKVPAEIVESFEAGKKPPVRITINGYTYRNTIAVMGGVYMVGVSAEHRKGAGVKGGDEIEVTIELDTDPRVVDVPIKLQKTLDENPAAKEYFEGLSNSKKKGIVIPINDAKSDETRDRRIEKAISALTEGKL
ncbi:MAG: hypothetical protein JWN56_61 [Sphingobacteriales bacterium]|nr:hypothetical protein [Sphingobacteriales bacterium]